MYPTDLPADGEYVHPSYLDGDQHEMALAAATALHRPSRPVVRAQALPDQAAPAAQGGVAVAVGSTSEEELDRLLQEQLARIRGSWSWSRQELQTSQLP